jgi:hypothetical protein
MQLLLAALLFSFWCWPCCACDGACLPAVAQLCQPLRVAHYSLCCLLRLVWLQFLKAARVDGAVVVTTPQEVSIIDVRKEINFCKKVGSHLGLGSLGWGHRCGAVETGWQAGRQAGRQAPQ